MYQLKLLATGAMFSILLVAASGGAFADSSPERQASEARPETAVAAAPKLVWPTERKDLHIREPAPSVEIYRAWSRAFGIDVRFDPRLRSTRTTLEVAGATAAEALAVITGNAGHFFVVLDEATILVADDTPQNRRTYETQVIRTFVLENLEIKEAITALRSLLAVKHVTTLENHRALVVRDTAAKVEILAALVRAIDKPRAEVAVDAEFFHVDGTTRADLRSLRSPQGGNGLPQRLSPAQLEHLREVARPLAGSSLSMLDGERARWDFTDTLRGPSGHEIGLSLEVYSRVHPESDEVRIEVALSVRDATSRAGAQGADPVLSSRAMSWSARLPSGEIFLLSGFLGTGKHRTGDAWSGSMLESLLDFPERRSGEIVLALTPRIVREPGFSESDLAELCIGTESTTELCGARWR